MSADSAIGARPPIQFGRVLARNLIINDRVRINASPNVIVIDDSKWGLPTPATAQLMFDVKGTVTSVLPTPHGQILFVLINDEHKVVLFMQHKHIVLAV